MASEKIANPQVVDLSQGSSLKQSIASNANCCFGYAFGILIADEGDNELFLDILRNLFFNFKNSLVIFLLLFTLFELVLLLFMVVDVDEEEDDGTIGA